MITFILVSISTTFGYLLGTALTNFKIDSQDWSVLRWHDEVFGYRTVSPGMKIYKNERVVMSLNVNTSTIPDEGMLVE